MEEYSYSKLTLMDTCPLAYYNRYVLGKKEETNSLAKYGTFMHSILEKYYKKELKKEDLLQYYVVNFNQEVGDKIMLFFSKTMSRNNTESYYDKGLNYFAYNFSALDEEYKVVGVEKYFSFCAFDYALRGFIDLILQDENGDIIVVDHKSSNPYTKKDLAKKKRQLYIYAMAIYDACGVYPKQLWYNFFNAGKIVKIDFNIDDLNEALFWTKECVEKIRSVVSVDFSTEEERNKLYPAITKNAFYCYTLCGYSDFCEYI